MDKRVKENGYYEVNCGVFDEREESENKGPYNVSIDIIGDEEKLDDVHSQMSSRLAEIYNVDHNEYTAIAEFVQNHFRQLLRRDLILDVIVGVDGIDDTPESLKTALDNDDVKFVQ